MSSSNYSSTISVVMSCYNAERWLDESIQSILAQTYRNFEFIIINDGSTDNTESILLHYKKIDRRIRLISKPNSGLADSLNIGISDAHGKWIARIDADDICEPKRLEKQLTKAIKEDAVYVGTGLTLINNEGVSFKRYLYPEIHKVLLRNLLGCKKFPPHSSAMYRRDAFIQVGGYRGRISLSEDSDLWLRMSNIGTLCSIREPLVRIRKHDAQISLNEGGKRQEIDYRMAIISYWLCKFNLTDPVDLEETKFLEFKSWVEEQFERDNFFEAHQFRIESVNLLKNVADFDIKEVINKLSSPLSFARVFYDRFVGEKYSYQLALRWKSSLDSR